MNIRETLTSAPKLIGLSGLAITLAACATEDQVGPTPIPTLDFTVTSQYVDGMRKVEVAETVSRNYCDGKDMVEVTNTSQHKKNDSLAGGARNEDFVSQSFTRWRDYPACSDGRLDPEDFVIPNPENK